MYDRRNISFLHRMDLSIFLAQLIGVLYCSVGLGMLVSRSHYSALYSQILASPAFLYFGGVFALFFGFIIISVHNLWTHDWRSLVTLIGWIAFLKGVTLLIKPSLLMRHAQFWTKNLNAAAYIALFLGILFGYFGFFLS